jgi:2-dehydro-3-deoxygluconokinase
MARLKIKPKSGCKYDILSLGEVMLRFDPGNERIHTARHFRVWEGGGEYNVARGLKRCFKKDAALVTAIPDCPTGYLLEDLVLEGGVSMEYVKWVPYDGIGRDSGVGLNFTERGLGVRAAVGCSDRGHSAASQIKKGDIGWEKIFGQDGVRWFHTGGIFAGLSSATPEVIMEAVAIAKKYGTVVSYDLNYRPSLWKSVGGPAKAREVNHEIIRHIDVLFGVDGLEDDTAPVSPDNFKSVIEKTARMFPDLKAIAATLRNVKTATRNDWGGMFYIGNKFYSSEFYPDLEILDRVGSGDCFASGIIYGLLEGLTPEATVNYGIAHGALAMTTPGDTSMASLKDVEKIMKGGCEGVDR